MHARHSLHHTKYSTILRSADDNASFVMIAITILGQLPSKVCNNTNTIVSSLTRVRRDGHNVIVSDEITNLKGGISNSSH